MSELLGFIARGGQGLLHGRDARQNGRLGDRVPPLQNFSSYHFDFASQARLFRKGESINISPRSCLSRSGFAWPRWS